MFTGLIEQLAEVLEHRHAQTGSVLVLRAKLEQPVLGESIAVNGVCLTLLASEEGTLAFDLSPETLSLTTLGHLKAGDGVNLERAMLASARFGGHYVSGHVDTTARVETLQQTDDYVEIMVGDFPDCAILYLLPKGSVTLNGVSLTINAVDQGRVKLMLVPHTLANTTFGRLKLGDRLNVEFDYLTRVVAHQLRVFHDQAI